MNGAIFDIVVGKINKFNKTRLDTREWKFEQTASLAIHNLKSPSYDKSLPPSGVKNEEGTTSEANLNVAMYLWKK